MSKRILVVEDQADSNINLYHGEAYDHRRSNEPVATRQQPPFPSSPNAQAATSWRHDSASRDESISHAGSGHSVRTEAAY